MILTNLELIFNFLVLLMYSILSNLSIAASYFAFS